MRKKIFIAGHRGLVGSALLRNLDHSKYEPLTFTHKQLDLTCQEAVDSIIKWYAPDVMIVSAGKVGGIIANANYPAEFMYENLMIAANCINSAYAAGVKDLLYLGSSCIYPRITPNPIKEKQLLSSALESTNEPYALAKIAGVKLCEYYTRQYGVNYRSVMPCNLYGIGDNYHETLSHVIPGLIRRFHTAKINNDPSVTIWGTGTPLREFLYADDLAKACYTVLESDISNSIINIGSGEDISIANLAELIKETVEYTGEITYDTSKPNGTPSKLMDVSTIKSMGWEPLINLKEGLQLAYNDYKERIFKS